MKHIIKIVPLLVAAVICGCSTIKSVLTPATVQSIVTAGAAYGIQADPTVVPYLDAATPLICQMAGTGVVDPQAIVATLQSSSANSLKTPTATILMNSILGVYEGVYYAYGSSVQASVVEPYLQAVCNGLTAALSPGTNLAKLAKGASKMTVPPQNWPHLK